MSNINCTIVFILVNGFPFHFPTFPLIILQLNLILTRKFLTVLLQDFTKTLQDLTKEDLQF
jgi:hypothetical protein